MMFTSSAQLVTDFPFAVTTLSPPARPECAAGLPGSTSSITGAKYGCTAKASCSRVTPLAAPRSSLIGIETGAPRWVVIVTASPWPVSICASTSFQLATGEPFTATIVAPGTISRESCGAPVSSCTTPTTRVRITD